MTYHIEEDWSSVFDKMETHKQIKRAENPEIPFASVLADEVAIASKEALANDPYALVGNSAELKNWVANERDAELAAIPDVQRWP